MTAEPSPSNDMIPSETRELEAGLRFLHTMCMQTKLAVERIDSIVTALARELEARKLVDPEAVNLRLEATHQEARARNREQTHVVVGPATDKQTVASPDIDCAQLLPLCKARCCRLTVHLSFQDLDDGLRWEYARPYELKRDATGYCVHKLEHGCGVYDRRPSVCRAYDCRNDKRVWTDFENRIPAPLEYTDRDPPDEALVQLRKRP
jgi:hypothetical protein